MGRAPCCSKVGLRTGPWSPKEDSVLINYIRIHGEGNWRNLPKKAENSKIKVYLPKAVRVSPYSMASIKANGSSSSLCGHGDENIIRPNNTEVPSNSFENGRNNYGRKGTAAAAGNEEYSIDDESDISFLDFVPIEDNTLDKIIEEYQQLLEFEENVQSDSPFSV
ncbi:hypothetical protein Pint_14853 [Pistacia integerrima]|uniref:Uncharacterized protein n=1 Tax=Pistacia integerrima TaxID=434235 RepID=A0ACC0ZFY6_9ROSI|nr:hypothetical protein Pint_14853 [Pistacia integerrima]